MSKKKARAKRRSAPEMLLALKEKEAHIEAKINAEKAANHPAVKRLTKELDGIKSTLIEASKGFGKGPQSFDQRLLSKQLWVDEINAQITYATIMRDDLHAQADHLKYEIGNISTLIVNGETPEKVEEETNNALESIPAASESVNNAYALWMLATQDRKEFTQQKKLSKKAKGETN